MVTYREIENYIKDNYNGMYVKSCWIAHVKEMNGIANANDERSNPCPNDKVEVIEDAFRNFGMI